MIDFIKLSKRIDFCDVHIFFKITQNEPKFSKICPGLLLGALPLKLSLWSHVSCQVSLVTLNQITRWYGI